MKNILVVLMFLCLGDELMAPKDGRQGSKRHPGRSAQGQAARGGGHWVPAAHAGEEAQQGGAASSSGAPVPQIITSGPAEAAAPNGDAGNATGLLAPKTPRDHSRSRSASGRDKEAMSGDASPPSPRTPNGSRAANPRPKDLPLPPGAVGAERGRGEGSPSKAPIRSPSVASSTGRASRANSPSAPGSATEFVPHEALKDLWEQFKEAKKKAKAEQVGKVVLSSAILQTELSAAKSLEEIQAVQKKVITAEQEMQAAVEAIKAQIGDVEKPDSFTGASQKDKDDAVLQMKSVQERGEKRLEALTGLKERVTMKGAECSVQFLAEGLSKLAQEGGQEKVLEAEYIAPKLVDKQKKRELNPLQYLKVLQESKVAETIPTLKAIVDAKQAEFAKLPSDSPNYEAADQAQQSRTAQFNAVNGRMKDLIVSVVEAIKDDSFKTFFPEIEVEGEPTAEQKVALEAQLNIARSVLWLFDGKGKGLLNEEQLASVKEKFEGVPEKVRDSVTKEAEESKRKERAATKIQTARRKSVERKRAKEEADQIKAAKEAAEGEAASADSGGQACEAEPLPVHGAGGTTTSFQGIAAVAKSAVRRLSGGGAAPGAAIEESQGGSGAAPKQEGTEAATASATEAGQPTAEPDAEATPAAAGQQPPAVLTEEGKELKDLRIEAGGLAGEARSLLYTLDALYLHEETGEIRGLAEDVVKRTEGVMQEGLKDQPALAVVQEAVEAAKTAMEKLKQQMQELEEAKKERARAQEKKRQKAEGAAAEWEKAVAENWSKGLQERISAQQISDHLYTDQQKPGRDAALQKASEIDTESALESMAEVHTKLEVWVVSTGTLEDIKALSEEVTRNLETLKALHADQGGSGGLFEIPLEMIDKEKQLKESHALLLEAHAEIERLDRLIGKKRASLDALTDRITAAVSAVEDARAEGDEVKSEYESIPDQQAALREMLATAQEIDLALLQDGSPNLEALAGQAEDLAKEARKALAEIQRLEAEREAKHVEAVAAKKRAAAAKAKAAAPVPGAAGSGQPAAAAPKPQAKPSGAPPAPGAGTGGQSQQPATPPPAAKQRAAAEKAKAAATPPPKAPAAPQTQQPAPPPPEASAAGGAVPLTKEEQDQLMGLKASAEKAQQSLQDLETKIEELEQTGQVTVLLEKTRGEWAACELVRNMGLKGIALNDVKDKVKRLEGVVSEIQQELNSLTRPKEEEEEEVQQPSAVLPTKKQLEELRGIRRAVAPLVDDQRLKGSELRRALHVLWHGLVGVDLLTDSYEAKDDPSIGEDEGRLSSDCKKINTDYASAYGIQVQAGTNVFDTTLAIGEALKKAAEEELKKIDADKPSQPGAGAVQPQQGYTAGGAAVPATTPSRGRNGGDTQGGGVPPVRRQQAADQYSPGGLPGGIESPRPWSAGPAPEEPMADAQGRAREKRSRVLVSTQKAPDAAKAKAAKAARATREAATVAVASGLLAGVVMLVQSPAFWLKMRALLAVFI